MSASPGAVADVVDAIVSYLRTRHGEADGVREFLARFDAVAEPELTAPADPEHPEALDAALTELTAADDPLLADIGHRARASAPFLAWRVDDGEYYKPGAGVGSGYRDGNMHTVLARGDDFAMGLFLLVPEVDYLDHRHAAPEVYLNLTGPTQWRFTFGDWVEMPAGSVLSNDPFRVHATRSGSAPWLSFWAWLRDTDQLCEVVEAPR